MTHQTATQIFESIEESQLSGLKRDVYQAAVRYARCRAEWRIANPEERVNMDAARTRSHDALIDSFKILRRAQARAGENTAWLQLAGSDRKELGDLAAYIHLFLALSAR